MIVRARRAASTIAIILIAACAADVGYQGRSSDEWIEQLNSPDPSMRVAAASALGKILEINPNAGSVVEALTAAVGDSSDDVRLAAATALTTDSVDSRAAIAGFHAALHDSAHADVRASMAMIIGTLGARRGRVLVPFLSEALSDPSATVRATATESLGMLGAAARSVAPSVAKLVQDPDPLVRKAAIQTLFNLRADAAVTLPAARLALRDTSASVRTAAAYALWPLGAAASPALSDLVRVLDDSAPTVKAAAAFAIGGIGAAARSAIPALRRLRADSSQLVRSEAARAIASLENRVPAQGQSAEPSGFEKSERLPIR